MAAATTEAIGDEEDRTDRTEKSLLVDDAVSPGSSVFDHDALDPVPLRQRTWTAWTYTAMWLGITVQPSSFVFGAALLASGLDVGGCALALTFGNLLLLGPLCLNGVPGAKYGIPYPIALRAVFGRSGAVIPVLVRALVGIGWAAFNLYLGGDALYKFIANVAPEACASAPTVLPYLNALQLGCYLAFLAAHVAAAVIGQRRLKAHLASAAVVQTLGAVALAAWAFATTPMRDVLETASALEGNATTTKAQRTLAGMTATCGGWSTLVLNIADLSRFAQSEREFLRGQLVAFPLLNITMPLLGILVFAAAKHAYPDAITASDWTLTALFRLWPWPAALVGTAVYVLSIFTTNCTANLLSAANDIGSVVPRCGFRRGFVTALLVATCICPWETFRSANGFVNVFLVGIGMFTGGILGAMLSHYYVTAKGTFDVPLLYAPSQTGGVVWAALLAVFSGTVLTLPGYVLATFYGVGWESVWVVLYTLSWPLSTVVAFGLHALSTTGRYHAQTPAGDAAA